MNKIIKWKVYKGDWTYAEVVEIYKPWGWLYDDKLKEIGIKTRATIVYYRRCQNTDFIFGLCNYMKLSNFKKHYPELIIT